jgi:hypothetical protein
MPARAASSSRLACSNANPVAPYAASTLMATIPVRSPSLLSWLGSHPSVESRYAWCPQGAFARGRFATSKPIGALGDLAREMMRPESFLA